MVWQTCKAVKIPVIGVGGICNWRDAVEFLLAGATAVQVGTYNFIDPTASLKIIDGIAAYCDKTGVKSVSELTGALEL
jgi:dihydroorotate dehydrogenase (NAD+) catalytic subunit